jgi:hypothetical protein
MQAYRLVSSLLLEVHTLVCTHECSCESDAEINTDVLRKHPSTGVKALREKLVP